MDNRVPVNARRMALVALTSILLIAVGLTGCASLYSRSEHLPYTMAGDAAIEGRIEVKGECVGVMLWPRTSYLDAINTGKVEYANIDARYQELIRTGLPSDSSFTIAALPAGHYVVEVMMKQEEWMSAEEIVGKYGLLSMREIGNTFGTKPVTIGTQYGQFHRDAQGTWEPSGKLVVKKWEISTDVKVVAGQVTQVIISSDTQRSKIRQTPPPPRKKRLDALGLDSQPTSPSQSQERTPAAAGSSA